MNIQIHTNTTPPVATIGGVQARWFKLFDQMEEGNWFSPETQASTRRARSYAYQYNKQAKLKDGVRHLAVRQHKDDPKRVVVIRTA